MGNDVKQPSFSRGELDPALHARTDLSAYQTGAETVRNLKTMRSGGLENRAGFDFVAEDKYTGRGVTLSSYPIKIIPFVFNAESSAKQSYMLEFGSLYMRVHKSGAPVFETSKAITAITNANPGVATTSAAHGYVAGDEVQLGWSQDATTLIYQRARASFGTANELAGMPAVNFKPFLVGTTGGGGTTFQLLYKDGTNVNTTSWGTLTAGGTVNKVYEIVTPYAAADLVNLKFVQLNDLMILTHPSYAPRKLVRTSDTSWALSAISFEPAISRPAGLSFSGTAGTDVIRYTVTAIDATTGEESNRGLRTGPSVITAITLSGGVRVHITTNAAHGLLDGDEVYFYSVGGTTELNNNAYIIEKIDADEFYLQNTDSVNFTAWTAGGNCAATMTYKAVYANPSSTTPITVTWTYLTGAKQYVIYRELNGVFGFVGLSTSNSFIDVGVSPDTSDTPPSFSNPFGTAGNYPSCAGFYQQRLCFANTTNKSNGFWASRINYFYNMTIHSPFQDTDAVVGEIVGRRAVKIYSMTDLNRLVLFTSDGEYVLYGDANGTLTPTHIDARQTSANGSASIPAQIVNDSAIYIQARSSMVRDLVRTQFQVDGYSGDERSIWASHLFRGYTVVDMAYQQVPDSTLWFVRSDGRLLALTYVREQETFSWSKHDTLGSIIGSTTTTGAFENCAVIPEGSEDALYVSVIRYAGVSSNTSAVRFIERLQSRFISDIPANGFVDSGVYYDGRNFDSNGIGIGATAAAAAGRRFKITTGGTWTAGSTLTLTSDSYALDANNIGDKLFLTGPDGTVAHLLISAVASIFSATVTTDVTIPASMQATFLSTWAMAKKTIYGLSNLVKTSSVISVQGDTFVEANPNKTSLSTTAPTVYSTTAASGSVVLNRWYTTVHCGLPYVSTFKSLQIDTADNFNSLIGKYKLVNSVLAFVDDSRGAWAGEDVPDSDSSQSGLEEMIPLDEDQSYDEIPDLTTGVVPVNVPSAWNLGGQCVITQIDPLPLRILAVAPQGKVIPQARS